MKSYIKYSKNVRKVPLLNNIRIEWAQVKGAEIKKIDFEDDLHAKDLYATTMAQSVRECT